MKDLTVSDRRVVLLAAVLAAAIGSLPVVAQVTTNVPDVVVGARPAIVERITIHGTALEGNLEGDAVDRDAVVFLPPSYHQNRTRRYPVVYALHGYSIGAEQWTKEIHVPQTIEGAFAKGAREMIIVMPDSKTVHNGSMYSSSVTTGDFENYVARDVVSYIDAHYRTIASRESRGLVGHSMGATFPIAAGFWLIPAVGVRGTTWIGVALNAAAAVGALWLARADARAPVAANRSEVRPAIKKDKDHKSASRRHDRGAAHRRRQGRRRHFRRRRADARVRRRVRPRDRQGSVALLHDPGAR